MEENAEQWPSFQDDGGTDASDFLKNRVPIHRQNSWTNDIIFTENFPNNTGRILVMCNKFSMQNICMALFEREEFIPSLKLLLTYFGVGRGGKSKFRNYNILHYGSSSSFDTID
jgi:hypothetical protein